MRTWKAALQALAVALASSSLLHAQAVLTDNASTASLFPKQNFDKSGVLVVSESAYTYLKFNLADFGPVNGNNVSEATLVL